MAEVPERKFCAASGLADGLSGSLPLRTELDLNVNKMFQNGAYLVTIVWSVRR